MALFPRTHAMVIQLAETVCRGLERHIRDFPSPPYPAQEMAAMLGEYRVACHRLVEARTRMREAQAMKKRIYAQVRRATKANLKNVEAFSRKDPVKLLSVGWGLPRPKSRSGPPGQVLTLRVRTTGKDWVELAWRAPRDGGAVDVYEIERRPEAGGDWVHAGSAVALRAVLDGQPGRTPLEYRVRALNKAGAGVESGVVRVVL